MGWIPRSRLRVYLVYTLQSPAYLGFHRGVTDSLAYGQISLHAPSGKAQFISRIKPWPTSSGQVSNDLDREHSFNGVFTESVSWVRGYTISNICYSFHVLGSLYSFSSHSFMYLCSLSPECSWWDFFFSLSGDWFSCISFWNYWIQSPSRMTQFLGKKCLIS